MNQIIFSGWVKKSYFFTSFFLVSHQGEDRRQIQLVVTEYKCMRKVLWYLLRHANRRKLNYCNQDYFSFSLDHIFLPSFSGNSCILMFSFLPSDIYLCYVFISGLCWVVSFLVQYTCATTSVYRLLPCTIKVLWNKTNM